jgi:hypothetical protein
MGFYPPRVETVSEILEATMMEEHKQNASEYKSLFTSIAVGVSADDTNHDLPTCAKFVDRFPSIKNSCIRVGRLSKRRPAFSNIDPKAVQGLDRQFRDGIECTLHSRLQPYPFHFE